MEQIILSPIPVDQLSNIIHQAIQDGIQSIADRLPAAEPSAQAPEYLTRQETAKRLSISLVTLNEWTKTGRIQGYRIGTRVRYKAADIDNALKAIRTSNK